MVSAILQVIRGVITVYMVLIFFRIIITWFQGPFMPGPIRIVARVTDPYLNLFRRFKFLRTQTMDFSPLIAIMVLVIVGNIVDYLTVLGNITVGLILRIILIAVWSACEFFLVFLLVLIIVRLVGILIRVNSTGPFWLTLDHLLEPVAYGLTTTFFKRRPFTFQNGLLFTGAILFLTWLIGKFIIEQLAQLLIKLPF